MLLHLIPFVAVSVASHPAVAATLDDATRPAQVTLADMLGGADAIDSVHAHGHTIVFAIERADESGYDAPFAIVATTDRTGKVIDVVEQTRPASHLDLGGLSWLAEPMQATHAVTTIAVDEDGAVTLTTADGQRYMAIPARLGRCQRRSRGALGRRVRQLVTTFIDPHRPSTGSTQTRR